MIALIWFSARHVRVHDCIEFETRTRVMCRVESFIDVVSARAHDLCPIGDLLDKGEPSLSLSER